MKCHLCTAEKETKSDRVPKGWKRHQEKIWCHKCWNRAYVLRAVTVPVLGPADKGEWPAFRQALKAAWADTTALANWAADEFYARDERRSDQPKCPPMPRTYLYPEARAAYPALPSQTVAAALHAVEGKYRATRYEAMWTRERALPTHRYPVPFTAPNQGWAAEMIDQRPCVHVRIGDRRWTLVLRGGQEFRRQLADIRAIISGDAVQGELAILRARSRESDHRSGMAERADNGQAQWRIMAKMVGWFPRRAPGEKSGRMLLRTAGDAIIVAVDVEGERIWRENADHLRRWIAEYDRQRQRWSEDVKAEQRPVPSFAARRDAATEKQRNRVNSAINEITSHVAKFAERRRVSEVEFDDTDRSYLPSFPWFNFREMLMRKLDERGIKMSASAPVVKSPAGDAREDVSHV